MTEFNAINSLESTNEYYQQNFQEISRKITFIFLYIKRNSDFIC